MFDFIEFTMPHGHCYLWHEPILWIHVISDAMIALAYVIIPAALVYIVKKRNDMEFGWMFMLFGAFIILCGMTHAFGIWTVWKPSYWEEGILKGVTAIISIATAYMLWKIVPFILTIPAPSTLQKEIDLHKKTQEVLEMQTRKLMEQTDQLEVINEELKSSSEIISSYVEQAGFEIKIPISNVLNYCERVLAYMNSDNIQDAKDMIGAIRTNTQMLDNELDTLLDHAISRSNIDLKLEKIPLMKCIDTIIFQKEKTYSITGNLETNNLTISKTGFNPMVSSDRMALTMMFDNIISGIIFSHGETEKHKVIEIDCAPLGYSKYHNSSAWKLSIMDKTDHTGIYEKATSNIKLKLIRSICTSAEIEFNCKTSDDGIVFEFIFASIE